MSNLSEEEKENRFYKRTVLFVVIIGTFMAILDSSIVNIALPKMMAVYNVSQEDAKWIITAYTLTLGAVIPLTGYLSNKFGTKNVYIYSLAFFTLGSLLCGVSSSNNMMIFSRILQALGGGMIMPVSMSILYDVIPPQERGVALGIWGIAAMAAPSIGPTLGGYIIEYLDWRLIFTLNIPLGIMGVFLSWILLKPSKKTEIKKFDMIGFITSTIGVVSLLYVFGEGEVDWNDLKNILLLIVGIFNLVMFVINELMIEEPLLDLRILKYMTFSMSIVISSLLNMALFGVVFVMPLFFQNLMGFSAMKTGLIMLPGAISTGIMMPVGGKLFNKYGAKPLLIVGITIMAVTTYLLSGITTDTPISYMMLLLAIRGIGLGLGMMPVTTEGLNAVPHNQVPAASALSNTIKQIASSISVTMISTILATQQKVSYAKMIENTNNFNINYNSVIDTVQGYYISIGYGLSDAGVITKTIISSIIQKQAFLDGVNKSLVISAIISVVCLISGLFMGKKKKDGNEEENNGEVEMSAFVE